MKRFSKAFSIFLVICLLFGVAVIASASAPEDKTEKKRNYDFALRLLNKPYNCLLDKWSEPDKNESVGHVEEGMKHCDTVEQ